MFKHWQELSLYSKLIKCEWRAKARQLIREHASDISSGHVHSVLESEEFRSASVIGLYFSVSTEPDTKPLMEAAFSLGKRVAVPIYNPILAEYEWAEYQPSMELTEAKYGIVEPKQALKIDPQIIDVCFLPGLLFDKSGVRLGHGGGFYDRLLIQISSSTPIIGLAFPWQIVDELPKEPHDIVCSKVIY